MIPLLALQLQELSLLLLVEDVELFELLKPHQFRVSQFFVEKLLLLRLQLEPLQRLQLQKLRAAQLLLLVLLKLFFEVGIPAQLLERLLVFHVQVPVLQHLVVKLFN